MLAKMTCNPAAVLGIDRGTLQTGKPADVTVIDPKVKWTIDTVDWRERDGERLRQRALAAILRQEGGIVLMHDAKEVTAKSIGLLLDDLEAANCQRLVDGKEPILPVSLHYWIRDHGKPRPVPEEVRQRTLAYRTALPDRCAARARPAEAEALAKQHAKAPARVAKAGRGKRAKRRAP